MQFNIFKKRNVVFKVQVNISKHSNVEVLMNNSDKADKDFILLGLLVYARILRLLSIKNSKLAIEICKNFDDFLNSKPKMRNEHEYLKKISEAISILEKTYHKDASLKVTCTGIASGDRVIYTNIPSNEEIDKYAYTIFNFAWNKISENNRFILVQAFAMLSNLKLKKGLSSSDAIEFPNYIIKQLI
jgi:hypothetical protein